jgi:hypothetical protein
MDVLRYMYTGKLPAFDEYLNAALSSAPAALQGVDEGASNQGGDGGDDDAGTDTDEERGAGMVGSYEKGSILMAHKRGSAASARGAYEGWGERSSVPGGVR